MKRRVVVTGMGVVTPIGVTIKTFWENLVRGVSGVDYIQAFDTEGFPTTIGAEVKDLDLDEWFTHKEKIRMESNTQYAIIAARQAISQAKLDMSQLDPYRVGVIVGTGMGGTRLILENNRDLLQHGYRKVSSYLAFASLVEAPTSEISMMIGAKGKSGAWVTACATGNNCIGEGCRAIQHGEADVMIAGGTEGQFTPIDLASFCKIKALSTRNDNPQAASRPFDKDRDGFVIGAGAGIVVLESEESAKKRGAAILAEIAGYGSTTDAYHVTAPDPEAKGAIMAMKNAMADANVSPADIDYISAHGSSTRLNDQIETLAIKKLFGEKARSIPVSSIKSMTGHLLAGSGSVELIACILALQHQIVPPTINHHQPDEGFDLNYVPNEAQAHRVRTVLNNSFGFGGYNACIVVKEWQG
ncbi:MULTISPECIES: beta-ketoacyl-ACP synthase II [Brevibacillus]|jgi:3-oxoacyl-[acyl-carrier-protein] synthase II|uniref:beta-ketoacyl-ACP synthase II n=1 Tax=Brevibacillus TaxID=55080 RepID=UPI0004037CF0|nr:MULTISPECIES: beta-ketoacyl-ACP synthase II [Brevibacillus]UYZ11977.1 beta-ketoacyl-ACP synthase II [Brevibacillus sp. WF146]